MSDALLEYESLLLDRLRSVSQQRVSLAAVRDATPQVWIDHLTGHLVAFLTAHVLSNQGGEPVTATKVIDRKVKPRWLPRWLWDRIFVELVAVKVTVRPLWTYPSADIKVPDLRQPVRVAVWDQHVATSQLGRLASPHG